MRESLVPYTRAIAREILGRADRDVTDGRHLHFGSIRVNLEKASYYDDATDVGGDLIDLVRRKKRMQNGAAEILIDQICDAEDRRKEERQDLDRPLPDGNDLFDLETERAIVGGLILHPEEFSNIGEVIEHGDFTFWVHQSIFDYVGETSGREKPIAIGKLVDECGGDDGGDIVPGFTLKEYIARIAADSPEFFDTEAHGLAVKLRNTAVEREKADADFIRDSEREDAREAARFKLRNFVDVPLQTNANYLVRGLLPRSGVIVLWGPPKCGKSFWAYDVAMHVALGREYRGRKVVQGPVVYLCLEGEAGYGARVAAFKEKKLKDFDGTIPLYDVITRIDMAKDYGQLIKDIAGQLVDAQPILIVVDTLNRSLYGSENSDEDMGNYIKAIDALREAFSCAVLIVHHSGIAGERPRGHTSLTGACDAQLAVKRDASRNVVVRVEYLKDGVEGDILTSRLSPVTVGYEVDGARITSCVVVPLEEKDPTYKIYKPTGKNDQLLMQCLLEALGEHGEPVSASGLELPRAITKVVQYRYVAEKMYERKITEHVDDPKKHRVTVRKAISVSGENLQRAYVLGKYSPPTGEAGKSWLWWTGKPVSGFDTTMPQTFDDRQDELEDFK